MNLQAGKCAFVTQKCEKVGGEVIKVASWPFQRCFSTRCVPPYPARLVSWCLGMPLQGPQMMQIDGNVAYLS